MSLVSTEAYNFKAQAVMPDDKFKEISLSDYRKGNVVLFFYPLDFTFVCPSEIIAFDKRLDEFEMRNTKILAVSVDSHFTHLAWKKQSYDQGGIGAIRFPIISDIKRDISNAYGVLMDDSISLRGTFIIDRNGIIRHESVNDLPLGRNVDEFIRLIDALHHYEKSGEVCPAGWTKNKASIKPTNEGITAYLSKNVDKL